MSSAKFCGLAAVMWLAVSLVDTAQAQSGTYDYWSTGYNVYGEEANPPAGFNISASSSNKNGATGQSQVSGLADFGTAKAHVAGEGAGFEAYVVGGWYDQLTFDAGVKNGQQGFVTVALAYAWTVSAGADGAAYAVAQADFYIGNEVRAVAESAKRDCTPICATQSAGARLYTYVNGAYVDIGPAPAGVASFVIPVTFGVTYDFGVSINGLITGGLPSATYSTAFVDAAHSLYWGGVLAVTDSNGAVLAYSLQSTSGVDYTHAFMTAVPEPSTWALFTLGLIALGLRRRHA